MGVRTLPYELDHQLKSSATIKEILAASSIMNLPAHAAGEEEQVDNSEDSCNDVIFPKVADIQGEAPSSELDRQWDSFLEEIAIDQAAPSRSNLDHLGSDDDQAVVASVRQE